MAAAIPIFVAVGALVLFTWMLFPDRSSRAKAPTKKLSREEAMKVGVASGIMGGDVKDAVIAAHAIERSKKSGEKITNRGIATSVAMRRETRSLDD